MTTTEGVWSAEGTSPAEIEAALRGLLAERHGEGLPYAPARVMNLVTVVDSHARGEIANRIERVGRRNPSRTIVCVVEESRTALDGWASMSCEVPSEPGGISVCHERVELDVGPGHLGRLGSLVDPLLVLDVPTVAWSPHGHPEAVDALAGRADALLLDAADSPDAAAALCRAHALAGRAEVVDLAWVRAGAWRERLAAAFDPPALRLALEQVERVTVRHAPSGRAGALLLTSWLASRLGWGEGTITTEGSLAHGTVSGPPGEIQLRLEAVDGEPGPGLRDGAVGADAGAAGLLEVRVSTASGHEQSLVRVPGGLRAERCEPGGARTAWLIPTGSAQDGDALAAGLERALTADPLFRPALDAAVRLLV